MKLENLKSIKTNLCPSCSINLDMANCWCNERSNECNHDWMYKVLHDHRAADVCIKCGRIELQDGKNTVIKKGYSVDKNTLDAD